MLPKHRCVIANLSQCWLYSWEQCLAWAQLCYHCSKNFLGSSEQHQVGGRLPPRWLLLPGSGLNEKEQNCKTTWTIATQKFLGVGVVEMQVMSEEQRWSWFCYGEAPPQDSYVAVLGGCKHPWRNTGGMGWAAGWAWAWTHWVRKEGWVHVNNLLLW